MAVNARRGNDGLRANCRADVLKNAPTHVLKRIISKMNKSRYVVSILSVVFIETCKKGIWNSFFVCEKKKKKK